MCSRHADKCNGGARTPLEIVASLVEELGEVSQEVLLVEQVGSKTKWSRQGSADSISAELVDLVVNVFSLAARYGIDLEARLQSRVGYATGSAPTEVGADSQYGAAPTRR